MSKKTREPEAAPSAAAANPDQRLADAVNLAEEAMRRGEYLTHEQEGERLKRFLRP